ncbi:MFS transporter [Paraburkholderia aromaticivorans]|uniref:MFS transporter n=1 Tax=Paraburkholderia aromaticivorans TaxID=2026199 RepID=UPI001455FD2B|nr:aromatic acid/H+ symport family MFS transporter [Paraburkholderia aromaticivorans]
MNQLNVSDYIAKSDFRRFHLILLIIGFFCVIFDGYDTAVFGAILPPMMKEWHLSPVEAGALGSYSLFGMLFGAITFGVLADRFGRKRMVAATVILFSLFTALGGVAPGPKLFGAFRFMAGLGLGGILPNAIALLTDYSPQKSRTTITAIMMCGYCLGGMLSPFIGILAIGEYGWRFVLWMGAAPLIFLPIAYRYMPESSFVLLRDGRRAELLALLARIDPTSRIGSDVQLVETHEASKQLPLASLFNEGRGLSTGMFTAAIFFHLILGYGLINWLPKLMLEAGFTMNSSLMFLIVLQCGAIVGTLVMGYAGDRYSLKRILVGLYLLGTVTMVLFALNRSAAWAYVLIAVAGVPVVGAQNLVQVYMSQFYPAFVRSSALGFSSSVGRVGGMLGPLLAGWLVSMSFSIHNMFFAFAIPGLLSALAISMVQHRYSSDRSRQEQKRMKMQLLGAGEK